MVVSVVEHREVVGTAELSVQCNLCGQTNVTDVLRLKTTDRLVGVVSIWTTYETIAKCPACNATVCSRSGLEDLRALPPEQIGKKFSVRVGLVEKFLVVAGWILFYTGPVALVLFLVAIFKLPPTARRWRKLVLAGLLASLAFFPLLFLVALIADFLF